MENITNAESKHKCANEQCQCQVPPGEEYCSNYCSDADDVANVEIQCNCEHPSCGLDECMFDHRYAAETNAAQER